MADVTFSQHLIPSRCSIHDVSQQSKSDPLSSLGSLLQIIALQQPKAILNFEIFESEKHAASLIISTAGCHLRQFDDKLLQFKMVHTSGPKKG